MGIFHCYVCLLEGNPYKTGPLVLVTAHFAGGVTFWSTGDRRSHLSRCVSRSSDISLKKTRRHSRTTWLNWKLDHEWRCIDRIWYVDFTIILVHIYDFVVSYWRVWFSLTIAMWKDERTYQNGWNRGTCLLPIGFHRIGCIMKTSEVVLSSLTKSPWVVSSLFPLVWTTKWWLGVWENWCLWT